MRMVVLHTQERYATLARYTLRDLCREVVRCISQATASGSKSKSFCKMRELLLVAVQRLEVLEVAYVLAWECVAPFERQKPAFCSAPAGEQPAAQALYRHRVRHVAARAAERILPTLKDPDERVVAAGEYLAVVQEEALRYIAEALRGLGVLLYDRRVERFALVITMQSMSSPEEQGRAAVCTAASRLYNRSRSGAYVLRRRRLSRTMGLRKDSSALASASDTSQSRRAQSRSRHMTAKGFSSLCFLRRSSHGLLILRQASQVHPAQAPSRRGCRPPFIRRRAASMPSPAAAPPRIRQKNVFGPQAGQQSGCAW